MVSRSARPVLAKLHIPNTPPPDYSALSHPPILSSIASGQLPASASHIIAIDPEHLRRSSFSPSSTVSSSSLPSPIRLASPAPAPPTMLPSSLPSLYEPSSSSSMSLSTASTKRSLSYSEVLPSPVLARLGHRASAHGLLPSHTALPSARLGLDDPMVAWSDHLVQILISPLILLGLVSFFVLFPVGLMVGFLVRWLHGLYVLLLAGVWTRR
ncbi:uncharacterized protein BJ171DRAFT_585397 [Polychytrium aggregatum]|uniref:uncharacterized protein n=1 Tax=Polychytrium aggregatum TaxID=110093 RepID=UPI0022FE972E|nr:uncharacterized protein BJ171DRAFT_585397 [Polychytrium aggregatum]KAI9199369.1 hypothetical protein BJ171DRAFT_585397 [Polychytrium aggregatum]